MTFPPQGSAWPPAPLSPLFDMVAEAATWWEGDPKDLTARYATGYKSRPSQFAGGVVGGAARLFWGAPASTAETKKLHLPLFADIANTSANMLFESPPVVTVVDEGGNDKAAERLDILMNSERFASDLLVGAESCAALGGVYWRARWDQDLQDEPWIEFVDADSAIPEWSNGRLVAVTIVETLMPTAEKGVWRLLTRYSPGRIDYELRLGEDNNLGKTRPFEEHPSTATLEVDQESGQSIDLMAMMAGYIPNALPVVGFRRNGQLKNMGRPDVPADCYGLLDTLDETWTAIRREQRLSAAKLLTPDYMLEQHGFGQGQSFDHDRELYAPINAPRGQDGQSMEPKLFQPDIRVEKYLATADALTREILRRANYSSSTFGMDSDTGGQKTAREIDAQYRATLQTWRAKSRYWKAALRDMAVVLLGVDQILNRTGAQLTRLPAVEMAPPIQETMLDKAQTIQALDGARAISTGEKVRMLRPDWDAARIDTEVADILTEGGAAPDPFMAAPDELPVVD